MYAIFESGGKQYRVTAGDILDIEKLDIPVGGTVDITNVLMIVDVAYLLLCESLVFLIEYLSMADIRLP